MIDLIAARSHSGGDRRRALRVLATGLSLLFGAGLTASHAQTSAAPDKPVRFVVGSTAGSATDVSARIFADKFSQAWHVPVIVENLPGAGGDIAGIRVANAAPDGLTYYWGASGTLTINPTLMPNPSLDVQRQLTPVQSW